MAIFVHVRHMSPNAIEMAKNKLVDPRMTNCKGRTGLELAVAAKQLSVARFLLSDSSYFVRAEEALAVAIDKKIDAEFVAELMALDSKKWDIKPVRFCQQPSGFGLVHIVSRARDFVLLRRIVKAGCSVDQLDAKRRSALHYACKDDCIPLISVLLSLGADKQIVDNRHKMPTSYASKSTVEYILTCFERAQKARDGIFTLMMIRKFRAAERENCIAYLPMDVVRLIAHRVWMTRLEV